MQDAPIEIVPYRQEWAAEFVEERRLLVEALGQWLSGPPEHIGSTAVPGLVAKPIIDIMVPVKSLKDSIPAIPAASKVGYCYFPYRSEVMHWFCKPSPKCRTHHLHLVPGGSSLWRERLAFRDALRANSALRDEYRAIKLELASRYRDDREAYTEAKTPFVLRVVGATTSMQTGAA